MSNIDFDGIVTADKATQISPKGEIVHIVAWLRTGSLDAEDRRLKALCKDYGSNLRIREDARGCYLDAEICVCSIKGVRAAKRRLAREMQKHLGIAATIQ